MSQAHPLQRQWSLIRLLCTRRFGSTLREIADELGISQKTVRRDLQTLMAVGFPLTEESEQHGRKRWRLEAEGGLPRLTFNFEEAAALHLGRRFLEPLAGTVFWESSQRAMEKIRATLGERALRYLEKLAGAVYRTSNGRCDYAKRTELIDRLMMGVEDQKITFVTYQSARATEPVTHELYPYGLVSHRHALYLIAFAPEHRQVRHYKVDRVEDVEVQPLKFNKPGGFDLQAHLENAFGVYVDGGPVRRVRVRFLPPVVQYVREHHWHGSQKLTPQRDGSLLAEFRLAALPEFKSWIQSFGANAVVLEPEDLREEVRTELETLLRLYGEVMIPDRRADGRVHQTNSAKRATE